MNDLEAAQDDYCRTRSEKDAQVFYALLRGRFKTALRGYLLGKGLYLPQDIREDVIEDASTRLFMRYSSNPSYHVRSFNRVITQEIMRNLHSRRRKRDDKGIVDWATEIPEAFPNLGIKEAQDALESILSDVRVNGKQVAVDLHRSKYFRRAIVAIAAYAPKQWMYDHAVDLRKVWKVLKLGGKNGKA